MKDLRSGRKHSKMLSWVGRQMNCMWCRQYCSIQCKWGTMCCILSMRSLLRLVGSNWEDSRRCRSGYHTCTKSKKDCRRHYQLHTHMCNNSCWDLGYNIYFGGRCLYRWPQRIFGRNHRTSWRQWGSRCLQERRILAGRALMRRAKAEECWV